MEFTEKFVAMIQDRAELSRQAHEIAIAYMNGRTIGNVGFFLEEYISVRDRAFDKLFDQLSKNKNEKAGK